MALKQILRPIGLIPSWSNDTVLDDPGEVWEATATKIEPGAGKRDDGFLPDEDISAQHVNYLLNELGKWVQLFSDIQIQNWLIPHSLPSTTPNSGNSVCFSVALGQWVCTGDPSSTDVRADRTANGFQWFEEDQATTSSTPLDYCFDSDAGVVAVGDGDVDVLVLASGTWTAYTSADDDQMQCGVFDPANALVLCGGHDDLGPVPVFLSSPVTISFTRDIPSASSSTTVVDMATNGQGLTLAIGNGTTGDTWTSTDGLSWTLRTTAIDNMVACWYNVEEALWMIVTSGGETWRSTDAISWSLIDTLNSGAFTTRCLRGYGSLWVCPLSGDSSILYSTDSGASWRFVFIPQAGATNVGWTGIAYSPTHHAYMLCAKRAGGDGSINMSLAVGTPTFSASTGTDDPPVVT